MNVCIYIKQTIAPLPDVQYWCWGVGCADKSLISVMLRCLRPGYLQVFRRQHYFQCCPQMHKLFFIVRWICLHFFTSVLKIP